MKDFLDAFKHLEKLCNEIYDGQHGVTQYIDEMESKSPFAARKVFGWDLDLSGLKRVRHIRNAMVHDSSDYDTNYTPEDVQFMEHFYDRIMNRKDPLTLLRLENEAARAKNRAISEPTIPFQPVTGSSPVIQESEDEKEWGTGKFVTIFLVTIAAIAIIVVIGWMFFI